MIEINVRHIELIERTYLLETLPSNSFEKLYREFLKETLPSNFSRKTLPRNFPEKLSLE